MKAPVINRRTGPPSMPKGGISDKDSFGFISRPLPGDGVLTVAMIRSTMSSVEIGPRSVTG